MKQRIKTIQLNVGHRTCDPRHKWRAVGLWLLAALLILGACTSPVVPTQEAQSNPAQQAATDPTPLPPTPTMTQEPLAALVNGEGILMRDYEQQVARYAASLTVSGQDTSTAEGQAALNEGRAWVLEVMIEQVLIQQAAAKANITVSDAELDSTIQSLREEIGEEDFKQWLDNEQMTLEKMREQLRNDMIATEMASQIAENVPTHSEHVQARHILVATEEEGKQILSQLQAGADFVELARTYSQDLSTRDNGGDLGYFPRGVLTAPEVEAVAFALEPGQIAGEVIPSVLGYHIVQVVQKEPDMEVSPENMRLLQDKAVSDWLEGLRASADIQRFVSTTP